MGPEKQCKYLEQPQRLKLPFQEEINNNNIYLTAIGLSPGGSGFKHIYKYLTLCY
jgi:hypothetical protein